MGEEFQMCQRNLVAVNSRAVLLWVSAPTDTSPFPESDSKHVTRKSLGVNL